MRRFRHHRQARTVDEATGGSWPADQEGFWSWQAHGACRQADSALFYSPEGERGTRKRRREQAAKSICATCPVVEVCAAYAIANREPYGIWGGLSQDDREAIYRRVDRHRVQADYRRALLTWWQQGTRLGA
jgi:WhiB family transcriptional regulator, redox-sensing transcriptional regulator